MDLKIKFKSKAELWFPTVIWETELDDNSRDDINNEILNYLEPYFKSKKLSQSNIIISETDMHEDKKTKNLNHFLIEFICKLQLKILEPL